jgi:hypothetical protein
VYLEAKNTLLTDTIELSERYDALYESFQSAILDDSMSAKFAELDSIYTTIARDTLETSIIRTKAIMLRAAMFAELGDISNARYQYEDVLSFSPPTRDSILASYALEALDVTYIDTLFAFDHLSRLGDLQVRMWSDLLQHAQDSALGRRGNPEEYRDILFTISGLKIKPNPFDEQCTIEYKISESDFVQLVILDALGNTVRILHSGFKKKGTHSVEFNSSSLPSGMYLCRLQTPTNVHVRTIVLIR